MTFAQLVIAINHEQGCGWVEASRQASEILGIENDRPKTPKEYAKRLRKAQVPYRLIPQAIELAFGKCPSISMIHRWLNPESAQRHRDREAKRYRDNL